MKFGQNMDVDDPKVDIEGQGHRSNIKVIGQIQSYLSVLQVYQWCSSGMLFKKRQVGSRQCQVAYFCLCLVYDLSKISLYQFHPEVSVKDSSALYLYWNMV